MPIEYLHSSLCNECLSKVNYLTETCEICSGYLENGKCIICNNREVYFKKNLAVLEYTGVIRDLLHEIKFNRNKRLINKLVAIIYPLVSDYLKSIDLITYVPINSRKERKRGFNQSYIFAKELAKKYKIPVVGLLTEVKNAESQRNLDFNSRFINVLGRYSSLQKNIGEKKNILIIDDIFTTGATINECARIIKEKYTAHVYALTCARAHLAQL